MTAKEAIARFEQWMSERRLMRRTRECYLGHAKRFSSFPRTPGATAEESVTAYLSWLAKLNKRITAHSFRHGFATSYLAAGGTIQELSELMGHSDIRTTEIYLHCIPQLASRVVSPLDNILQFPIRRSA